MVQVYEWNGISSNLKIHNSSSYIFWTTFHPFAHRLLPLPMPAPSAPVDPLCVGTRTLKYFRTFPLPCLHPGSCWLQTDWCQTMKLRSFAQGGNAIKCNSQFRNCPSKYWVKSYSQLGSSSILGCIFHSCTKVGCNTSSISYLHVSLCTVPGSVWGKSGLRCLLSSGFAFYSLLFLESINLFI